MGNANVWHAIEDLWVAVEENSAAIVALEEDAE